MPTIGQAKSLWFECRKRAADFDRVDLLGPCFDREDKPRRVDFCFAVMAVVSC
jgi:hypothetical protein